MESFDCIKKKLYLFYASCSIKNLWFTSGIKEKILKSEHFHFFLKWHKKFLLATNDPKIVWCVLKGVLSSQKILRAYKENFFEKSKFLWRSPWIEKSKFQILQKMLKNGKKMQKIRFFEVVTSIYGHQWVENAQNCFSSPAWSQSLPQIFFVANGQKLSILFKKVYPPPLILGG